MSCLIDLKIVSLIGDDGDDFICNHLNNRNSSFLRRMIRKTSAGIKKATRKYILKRLP